MMDTDHFYSQIVQPTLPWLTSLTGGQVSTIPAAYVMVMAIAGQESDWNARRQIGGPARGFWQFEKGGGVAQLFGATPIQLRAVCDALIIPYNKIDVFEAMAWNDQLACSMARLLLWQDAAALPEVGLEEVAWQYYFRNWRPGAPSRERWATVYPQSVKIVQGAAA